MEQQRFRFVGSHGGRTNGHAAGHRRALDRHRALLTPAQASAQGRSKTRRRPAGLDGHYIRIENRHPLGRPAARDGLRLRHDLLATPSRLADSRRVAGHPPCFPQSVAQSGPDRLVPRRGRQRLGSSRFWGEQTGPNPTDRRKNGSKHHIITDANGVPLATTLTGANRHDVTQLLPLVLAIPPISGKTGRPRRRPERVQGDRAYHSDQHRNALVRVGIEPVLARRGVAHGSGLGTYRWVVERTLSWLHQFRRLRVRYERRADIHEAFMTLGCVIICWRTLENAFC